MSRVANVMLSVGDEDHLVATAFSEWLRLEAPQRDGGSRRGCGYLTLITDQESRWGGWKFPECDVWAGALNHADLDAVLAHVRQLEWNLPNAVQLMIMDQEQCFFRVWMFRDGELRQYAPLEPDEGDPEFYPPDLR